VQKRRSRFFDDQAGIVGRARLPARKENGVARQPVAASTQAAELQPDPAIRQSFNVSQAAFARIINVSVNAVESWEQGVRRPREATLKLLSVADRHPEVLLAGE
jgi:DNA-binding transcriptional regulator YiaG